MSKGIFIFLNTTLIHWFFFNNIIIESFVSIKAVLPSRGLLFGCVFFITLVILSSSVSTLYSFKLSEENIIGGKEVGFICIGQNWNGMNVVGVQQKVLNFYGFKTPDNLFWNWQYTDNAKDETEQSYRKAYSKFKKEIKK